MSAIAEEKAALRTQIRARVAALTGEERRESDEALFSRFLALPEVAEAEHVLLYLGMGGEPDTYRLLEPLRALGKRVALPRILPGRGMEGRLVPEGAVLVRHPYGMLEPGEDCPLLPREAFDLVLVPGLAFDRACQRLGQGGGYYDRYLAGFPGHTIALCREVCLLSAVPAEVHDAPVETVLTERAIFRRA